MSNVLHDLAELGHTLSDHIKVLADLVDEQIKKNKPAAEKAAKKAAKKTAEQVVKAAADQAIKKF